MGMFDYIICHYKLPDNPTNETEFQTKDLINGCAEYALDEHGNFSYRDRLDRPFHGRFEFYTYAGLDPTKWLRYEATITHGQLTGLIKVEQN
jgi:hypothetical protein